jgi:hypothetical protein
MGEIHGSSSSCPSETSRAAPRRGHKEPATESRQFPAAHIVPTARQCHGSPRPSHAPAVGRGPSPRTRTEPAQNPRTARRTRSGLIKAARHSRCDIVARSPPSFNLLIPHAPWRFLVDVVVSLAPLLTLARRQDPLGRAPLRPRPWPEGRALMPRRIRPYAPPEDNADAVTELTCVFEVLRTPDTSSPAGRSKLRCVHGPAGPGRHPPAHRRRRRCLLQALLPHDHRSRPGTTAPRTRRDQRPALSARIRVQALIRRGPPT